MSYAVKSIVYTLQGEGANTGRPAVFLRFSGCNLWTGREPDRATARCRWCDTDFVGTDGPEGGLYAYAERLARAVRSAWPQPVLNGRRPFVVCTGGEPALQLDAALIEALHAEGFEIAIETNGTRPLPPGIDWVCVSPKAGEEIVVRSGNELKIVFPQNGLDPSHYAGLDFQHFYLQPLAGIEGEANTRRVLEYCLAHPKWKVSLQTHKILGVP